MTSSSPGVSRQNYELSRPTAPCTTHLSRRLIFLPCGAILQPKMLKDYGAGPDWDLWNNRLRSRVFNRKRALNTAYKASSTFILGIIGLPAGTGPRNWSQQPPSDYVTMSRGE